MLNFSDSKSLKKTLYVTFDSIPLGETFIRKNDFESHGLDEESIWIYIKASDTGGVKLNPDGSVIRSTHFGPESEVLIVELKISEISVK